MPIGHEAHMSLQISLNVKCLGTRQSNKKRSMNTHID